MNNSNTFQRVADGIYKRRDCFYYRPYRPDGKRTWRALDGLTLKAARENYHRLTLKPAESQISIGHAIQIYRSADCPDRKREPRTGKKLTNELAHCDRLFTYWQGTSCADLTAAMLDDYADWRIKQARKGHGGRAADLEIVTLKNVLRWAVRKGLLLSDPFNQITVSSYRRPTVRHCRQCAPTSGNELHALAEYFFEDHQSEVLGWLALITAMIGGRISEVIELRWNAPGNEPGAISNGILWVRRKKGGVNNFVKIHPALATCLKEFKRWHDERKPSPWWFPGRDRSQHVQPCSLTHALQRASADLELPERTAHGLRSFYVTVRRSQGATDPQIALEIGQTSGGREIVKTYGDALPVKLSWMPRGKPAWAIYQKYTSSKARRRPAKKPKIRVLANASAA